ncbi:unnamed protein product [Blepharisma stoltei]|uniref:Uncharacterized protein n=1 Tax=Blepharisma stoltei TaxID=1481888 RepID=A0AAU9J2A2_9CILI|nr:unnamed protein product [Blepharisma stoltei]
MEQVIFGWISLCIICSTISYYFGKYIESKKLFTQKNPYSELDTEDDDPITKKEPKSADFYKRELEKEKETKKKLIEEYEHELNYLKFTLEETKTNYAQRIKLHEESKNLFEEINNEIGPVVKIVDNRENNFTNLDEEIEREINLVV